MKGILTRDCKKEVARRGARRMPGPSPAGGFEPLAEAQAAVEDLLEKAPLLAGGLQLQVHRVGGEDLQGDLAATDGGVDLLDPRGVRPVERIGYAQEGGQAADRPLLPGFKGGEGGVAGLRSRPPVVAGDMGDDLDLALVEGVEHGVVDQVVGVLVMPPVVDGVADVVEQGGKLSRECLSGKRANILYT